MGRSKSKLDFDAPADQPAEPLDQDEPVDLQPAAAPDAAPTPAPAAPAADEAPPPGAVICQRCQLICKPVGPPIRGWVKCPKCGWKHKVFDRLKELRRAKAAQTTRAAR